MLPNYSRSWILGEDKYVDLEIHSRQPGIAVIPRAEWSLTRAGEIKAEKTGICEIDGSRISALIEPNQTGKYVLEITYEVPPETRKVRVTLDVH